MNPTTFLLLASQGNMTLYLLPLALVVSLVYSASRYELPERILRHAAVLLAKILVFMAVIQAILWMLSFKL